METSMIGKRLRELRGEKTLAEVAESLGLTKGAVSQYELGYRVPSDAVKIRIAAYYGVTVQSIFYA